MEFVRRLTAHEVTPGTALTAFSTCAWQAAQLIPVTLYLSIFSPFSGRQRLPEEIRICYFMSFSVRRASSSMTASFPFLMSSATQPLIWAARSSRLKALRAEIAAWICTMMSGQ